MPFFGNKFTPKTIPVRKQDTSVIKNEFGSDYAAKEFSIDVAPLTLKLGDFEISFEDGQWIPGCEGERAEWRRRAAARLQAENNMLRLKLEVLLGLAAEARAPHTH